jgi:hypothetical protein
MRSPLTQCKIEGLIAIALLKEACQQEGKYNVLFTSILSLIFPLRPLYNPWQIWAISRP